MKPLQRQEEEEVQAKLQRQPIEEEEEELQTRALQRQEEEELQTKPIIQTKLTVNPPDDKYEQEADHMADQVVQRISSSRNGSVQRQAVEEEEEPVQTKAIQRQEEEEEMQMKPLQRQEEGEEELQTKPQRKGSYAVPTVNAGIESQINTAKGTGRPLPENIRGSMENSFGKDFSGVRVHSGSQADTLSQSLQAKAFTTGQDIFFKGSEYNPESSEGQRLIAHELTHVVQQSGGASAKPIQRDITSRRNFFEQHARQLQRRRRVRQAPPTVVEQNYDSLSSMAKARVDSQADRKYFAKTRELEFKMGALLSKDPNSLQVADKMLGMLKKIVDAWAEATGKEKGEVYEREFSFKTSDKYYGAFLKTADNIKQVFNDKSQPLRAKLHLIYNAVRNNNMAKYLELAALELDSTAKTPIKIISSPTNALVAKGNTTSLSPTAKQETVAPGFAKSSGLQSILESEGGKRKKSFTDIAKNRKWVTDKGAKIFGQDIRSDVHNWSPEVLEASKSRRGSQSRGLSTGEQRTLTSGNVPDLTPAEFRKLRQMSGKRKPLLFKKRFFKKKRKKFMKDKKAKIAWEQGREFYDVILNSKVDQEAAKLKARLEAGISGSTDLMLHAAQNLALSEADQKKLRLALLGWMLSNRDHSFYEIMMASKAYGLDFKTDENHIGYEYEAPENFDPMEVQKIKNLLPEKKFPSYFLSKEYKDELAKGLKKKGTSADKFKKYIETSGIPKAVGDKMGERDLVELSRLAALVKKSKGRFDTKGRKGSEIQNRTMLRRLKEDPSFMYLARKFPVHGDFMLAALMKQKVGPKALTGYYRTLTGVDATGIKDDRAAVVAKITGAGVPEGYIYDLPDWAIYDLQKFQLVVKASPFKKKGFFSPFANSENKKLTNALMGNALLRTVIGSSKLQRAQARHILNAFIRHHHGDAVKFKPKDKQKEDQAYDAFRPAEIERIAEMQKTTGTWFSWGNLGYQRSFENASDIKQHALGADRSSGQGLGLYVCDTIDGSCGYGKGQGCGLMVITMKGVPTISILNAEQKTALSKLRYQGKAMTFESLYKNKDNDGNYAGLLLQYVHGGDYTWARLTTSRGISMTTDLKTVDPNLLESWYDQIHTDTDERIAAKANMKKQAKDSGVDVSGWLKADRKFCLGPNLVGAEFEAEGFTKPFDLNDWFEDLSGKRIAVPNIREFDTLDENSDQKVEVIWEKKRGLLPRKYIKAA